MSASGSGDNGATAAHTELAVCGGERVAVETVGARSEAGDVASAPTPRMLVKEKNGEVSASVEETNRVRALLGMAPLKVPGATTSARPEMLVKEKNGEVSASVEETNRVRALLGMAPLKVPGATTSAHPEYSGRRESEAVAAQSEPTSLIGPALPPPTASDGTSSQPSQHRTSEVEQPSKPSGKDAVLALKLERYTSARTIWR